MPTRDDAWPAGTPCWVDYNAADVDAAKEFYTAVVGWTYEGGDPMYGGYSMCQANGRDAAGMGVQQSPDDAPRWTTYFASDDADATAERITKAGGTLYFAPTDVGPMGRMTIAVDPAGHPFGVWQAGERTGVQVYNEPGSLVWNDAAVDDIKAEQEFYSSVFDFTFEEIPDMGGYATFSTGGGVLGGIGGSSRPDTPKGWTTCFSVASVDDAVAATEAGGGKVMMPAADTSFGRFAVVSDPWGASFSLMSELPA